MNFRRRRQLSAPGAGPLQWSGGEFAGVPLPGGWQAVFYVGFAGAANTAGERRADAGPARREAISGAPSAHHPASASAWLELLERRPRDGAPGSGTIAAGAQSESSSPDSDTSNVATSRCDTDTAPYLAPLSACIGGPLRFLKRSPTGGVAAFQLLTPGGPLPAVLKHGRVHSWRQRLGSVWHGPKEWREFWWGHQLRAAGIATPVPIACLWKRVRPGHYEAQILLEAIPDARPLDQTLRRLGRGPALHLRMLVEGTALLISHLGRSGLYHRDLKPSNILVSSAADCPQPWLIDLDGLKRDARPFGPGFRRSLLRLSRGLTEAGVPSRSSLARGLRRLVAASGEPGAHWKDHWRKLQTAAPHRRRIQAGKLATYEPL